MRKALDALYAGALYSACLAMATIALLVFIQIAGRVIDRAADLIGAPRLGLSVPSLAEFGGFLFIAAAFLALAPTFRAAVHIRVTLALRHIGPRADRMLTGAVLLIAFGLAAFAAWVVGYQTFESYQRGSVSYGLIPIPLFLPQVLMTGGLVIFAIAILDDLVNLVLKGETAFRRAELEREAGEGGH